jgi:hypothetical protein
MESTILEPGLWRKREAAGGTGPQMRPNSPGRFVFSPLAFVRHEKENCKPATQVGQFRSPYFHKKQSLYCGEAR